MATKFEATYEATPTAVSAVRNEMAAMARDCGMDDALVADVRLAVSEAATNALIHGSARRAADSKRIHVEAERLGDELVIGIADEGDGLRPRPDSPGLGLGLSLMATLSTRLEFQEADPGTRVCMAFACPSSH